MMTREEFERTVRAMKAEGVPLSMPQLMLRTELPRHVIEDWLDDMAAAERRPPSVARQGRVEGDKRGVKGENEAKNRSPGEEILRKVGRLRDEVIGDAAKGAVRERFGMRDDDEPVRVHGAVKRPRKDLRVGAGLGLLGGPFGLFYAAPYPVAIMASTAYVTALVGLGFIPVVGSWLVAYLLPVVHLTSAAAGVGYTWRFNRAGHRAALLPKNHDA